MHTGMVQPSGPSIHFWINSGSVWARYTASGDAANRLVTTTWVSPSVFSVSLLIVFLLLFSSSVVPGLIVPSLIAPGRREGHPAGRSLLRELFVTWPATGPLPQCRAWRGGAAASCRQCEGSPVRPLQALSDAGRWPAATSRT